MSKQGFRVLDSDLHVIEPQDLYERYLDRRYARRAPRPLEARQAYVSNWIVDGWVFPRPIGRGRPDAESRANVVLKEYAAAHFDSASQLRAMEVEGLDLAVLFRTLPVVCVDAFDPEFAVGLCHAWNDWAADFVRPAPERMKAAALLTLHDATLAANELRRAVTDLGFIAGNCSWLPWLLWRLDEYWKMSKSGEAAQLQALPSEYFRRQCFISVDVDEDQVEYVIEKLGNDNLVFSTDYPHSDSHFPEATDLFLKLPLSQESKRKILWDNCARLYGVN